MCKRNQDVRWVCASVVINTKEEEEEAHSLAKMGLHCKRNRVIS